MTEFLPTTPEELKKRGWDQLDVILVSGDSYIDSPFIGAAVIGRVLEARGYKVGIIAQPDISTGDDIRRLGEPRLFWGVTGGSVDSMVANYTASNKRRKQDDYTPGGENSARPDRAVIVYSNLIRRHFKRTVPIVLGGIEASLRRVAHYDYWSNSVRRSILFDAKADFLLYGMAERSVIELADALASGSSADAIRGLCWISKSAPEGYLQLPAYEEVSADKLAFIRMFKAFYNNNDAITAHGLAQPHGDRYLIQNPPAAPLSQPELDAVYALPFQRSQHPWYQKRGSVRALDTIQFSISTHRGCYGECNFCAIAVHEGRTVSWRSEQSILDEAASFRQHPDFKGIITDVGGPSANMYGYECAKKLQFGACADKRCIFPDVCKGLRPSHAAQTRLLKKLREIPGVRKVFVASGLRTDLIFADKKAGHDYLEEVVTEHVSGQMKIAPEHVMPRVLALMGKPEDQQLEKFKNEFEDISARAGKKQFLSYYLIAAHPGCSLADMEQLRQYFSSKMHLLPEQVQIFTPTPSTYSTLMYYTGLNPFTLKPVRVETSQAGRQAQKDKLFKPR